MATYVLLHGSYQGGWIWQKVADRLRVAGHLVYAPSLDGCAERKDAVRPGITTETQADEVAQLLFYEDLKEVVLVGTSSGGMVVWYAEAKRLSRTNGSSVWRGKMATPPKNSRNGAKTSGVEPSRQLPSSSIVTCAIIGSDGFTSRAASTA